MPVSGGGFEQAYNAQAVVDNETLLIVSNPVSQYGPGNIIVADQKTPTLFAARSWNPGPETQNRSIKSDRLRYGCSKIMGARGGSENETQFRGYTVISLLKERLDNEQHRVFLTREVKIHVRDKSRTSAVGG